MDANEPDDTTSNANPQFQREKWLKACEYRDRELAIKERELTLRDGELAVKRDEVRRTLFSNPLTLALLAATVAATANVWVAYHNGNEQRTLEVTRAISDQTLERQKAEDARIESAINGDPNIAAARLRFLVAIHLITDRPLGTAILQYIQTQTISVPPTAVNPTTPKSPSGPSKRVTVESGWLDGGHSQPEVCGGLAEGVKAQYQGKNVKIVNMSEKSHKDFLGHVTYKYRCEFEID